MKLLSQNLTIDKASSVPVYLQIANGIIAYIKQGMLKPGTQLPASRHLAVALAIHRKTVIAAYDELFAQSWIDVYPRIGAFVAKRLPEIKARPIQEAEQDHRLAMQTFFPLDGTSLFNHQSFVNVPDGHITINDGFPDTRIAPLDLLIREYRRITSYHFTHKYLHYGPEQGSENLRMELAKFLSETRGLNLNHHDILITKGVQMAIYLVAQLLLKKNDVVIVADPGFVGANEVFEYAGAQLELVGVDAYGIDLNAIEAICQKKTVRMVYVIPHHHTPTTVTLCSERRMRLLDLARKYKFPIIEDDYDFDFHYRSSPLLPLASADYEGHVIYIGSFSKIIAPGIRIGFMVAPKNFMQQAIKLRRIIDRQGEQLLEEAMANLLKNGDIKRHLKKANKIYHARRDYFCNLLTKELSRYLAFEVPDGGLAVWASYLNGLSAKKVADTARELGLSLGNGCEYYHYGDPSSKTVRLGFASLTFEEMEEAIGLLKKAILKASNPALSL